MRSSGSTAPKRGERLGPPGIPARDAETQPNLLVERLFPSSYWALDEEKAFVIVRASTTKNSKVAPMTLHPELVGVLREIKAESQPDELVFKRFPRIERFKQDLKKAGISYQDTLGRYADFHALRNTLCTNLAKAGGSDAAGT